MTAHQSASSLRRAHDALLYRCAYPESIAAWEAADHELRQLAIRASELRGTPAGDRLQNSGIAGTLTVGSFSLALTRWLADRYPEAVLLDSIDADSTHVMAVLDAGLDPVEREVLSEQPLTLSAWQRRYLGPSRGPRLQRLLTLLEQLPGSAAHREAVFASLGVFVRWQIAVDGPVLTTGRFARGEIATHPRGLKRRSPLSIAWGQGPATKLRLTEVEREGLVELARGTLGSQLGETDPFTHANVGETECHDLGRGIRVALFACAPPHKLALEAYVGYLLLKNHVPVAYGGGWVLGRQARFGINVLPPFRGGESAVLLSQLLRLYAHRFKLKLFLVDPYQIGLGNPDGIQSGAFWFYWRLGFRPRQRELLSLARTEAQRLRARGGHTPVTLLRRLSHAVMGWETPLQAAWTPVDVEGVGVRVSAHVAQKFDGDRVAATRSARRALGLRDGRLAVLLATIAPADGWRPADVEAIDNIMAAKDRNELDQARRLGRLTWLMDLLARAFTPNGTGQ